MPSFSKILVATDFSEGAERALACAEELAAQLSAELLLLHVDQPLSPVSQTETPSLSSDMLEQVAEEHRISAQRELDRKVNGLREKQLRARSLLRVGNPFLEIVRTAKAEGVDLIVVGTHGRTALVQFLIGSVAERVVRYAPCAVLAVPDPSREYRHPLAN